MDLESEGLAGVSSEGEGASSSSSSSSSASCQSPDCSMRRDGLEWSLMARAGRRALERSKRGGPKPQRLPNGTWVTAKYWGISRAQLESYYYECCEDPQWRDTDSVADFVPKFVKPRTDGTGMGLALFLNQESPQQVNVMVSHAWQENAMNFFEDVLKFMMPFEVAFICFLSNYQGTREEIDAQLGGDISVSPFTEVLSSFHTHRMLVVPNEELRGNGEGLYSRLWCDWEIKVAADMGLPIHLTQRTDLDYLLGSNNRSSRTARCGDPRLPPNVDEQLIREAIENRPVEGGKFQSLGVFVFSICVAYGPRVAVWRFGNTYWTWLCGYPGGIALGAIILSGCLRPMRNLLYTIREQDGYRKLDSIIKSAARQEYTHRRFRPRHDLPIMAFLSISVCLMRFLFELWWNAHWHRTVCSDEYFFAILAGLYEGLILWPVVNINSMGPWTGVFILRPRNRILVGLYVLCMIGAGAGFFNCVLKKHGDGQGALWGVLSALASISLWARRWKHTLGLLVVLGYMVACYFLMLCLDSWLLWRDSILVALGASGFLMVTGLSPRQTFAAWCVCPCSVIGLAVLACVDREMSTIESHCYPENTTRLGQDCPAALSLVR